MMLFDKYNPNDWPDFAGHARQVATVRRIIEAADYNRGAFYITGPSGIGKSTLANIITRKLAREPVNRYTLDQADQSVAQLQTLFDDLRSNPGGRFKMFGHVVVTINECHALSPAAIKAWLTMLESKTWPIGCTFLFTTTEHPAFGNFQRMMQDRMITLDLQPSETLVNEFARYARAIAEVEGLDGADLADYVNVARDCQCSLRGLLAQVQGGVFAHPPSDIDLLV